MSIRAHLATSGQSDTPLTWLNTSIDAVAGGQMFEAESREELFAVLLKVMSKCRKKYEQVRVFKYCIDESVPVFANIIYRVRNKSGAVFYI